MRVNVFGLALAIQEKTLGPEHPDTAATLHTLGELNANLGDLKTGLDLVARASTLRQQALGLEHPDTLDSMTLLALMSAQRGDAADAEQSLARVLPICERALDEDHLTTARVLNRLGPLYAANEAIYARAKSLYERTFQIYERLVGPDHPQTALVLNNLAAVLSDMQDDGAALPLLERSLAVHERVCGGGNWRISFVLVNLAKIHNRQGGHAAARPLLERALIIRERAWGARHPETVSCLRKLVATLGYLHRQGDEGATLARMALYPCLTSLERVEGKRDAADAMMPGVHLDPDKATRQPHRLVGKLEADLPRPSLTAAQRAELETASALARQADEFYQQGDYASAALRLEEALGLQERVLGKYHLDHIPFLKRLADTKERQGQYSAALPLMCMLGSVTRPSQAHTIAVLLLDSALLGKGRTASHTGTPEATEDRVFYGTVHSVAADGIEERIYPQGEGEVDISALTRNQRQALQAVLDCPAVWGIHSNLLQLYGLPPSLTGPRRSGGASKRQ